MRLWSTQALPRKDIAEALTISGDRKCWYLAVVSSFLEHKNYFWKYSIVLIIVFPAAFVFFKKLINTGGLSLLLPAARIASAAYIDWSMCSLHRFSQMKNTEICAYALARSNYLSARMSSFFSCVMTLPDLDRILRDFETFEIFCILCLKHYTRPKKSKTQYYFLAWATHWSHLLSKFSAKPHIF